MTEEQADRWIAIAPSESQTHTHNANTHIHTLEHTHSNTHMPTHSFPLSGRGQTYIAAECTTIINISINDPKAKILFPQIISKKC